MKGGSPIPIAANIVVSDAQSTTLSSATISFANWQAGDRLDIFNTAALQTSFFEDLGSHTAQLTLIGTRSLAAYQFELRSLEFFNVAGNPSMATRVASIQVSDGIALSNIVSENILVGQVPSVTGLVGAQTYMKGGAPLSFASGIGVNDNESTTLQSATITFTNWRARRSTGLFQHGRIAALSVHGRP